MIGGLPVLLAAKGDLGLLHAHILAEIDHLVHSPVQNQVVLAVVALFVRHMGKVAAAGGGNGPPQLQGDMPLPAHFFQQLPETGDEGFFFQVLAKVGNRKPGAVFQLR